MSSPKSRRMKLEGSHTIEAELRNTDTAFLQATGLLKSPALMPEPQAGEVDEAIAASREWLLGKQDPEGWWCAELEADTTLESYFILFKTLFGHRDDPKIPKLAKVLR